MGVVFLCDGKDKFHVWSHGLSCVHSAKEFYSAYRTKLAVFEFLALWISESIVSIMIITYSLHSYECWESQIPK